MCYSEGSLPWDNVYNVSMRCVSMRCGCHTVAAMYNLHKAGRLVGFADCYAVIALADNATFLLAVNRIAAVREHSAIMLFTANRSRGSVGRVSAPPP